MTASLVELVPEDPGWLAAIPDLEQMADAAAVLALKGAGVDGAFAISLLACGDARIAELNGAFRDRDRPTNVLSWPAQDLTPPGAGMTPPLPATGAVPGPTVLGDVAIALQTCQAEAEKAAKPLKMHVRHLILHGCLHLLGFDHETPEDAALMEGLESRLLTEAGDPDPYG